MRLTLRACAKINLDLRVGARGPDGYHQVRSLFQTLDLHDTVTVESSRGAFALDGDPALMPLDHTNLVWRAAEALWRASGKSGDPRGARVRVSKRIPARAGLGGGSSDAAAALIGLSRLWRLRVTLADLVPVATMIGSDVAFFLVGGTALGLGRGEQLYPLVNRPRRHVVLVLPAFGVSTIDAYRWLAEDRASDVGLRASDCRLRTAEYGRWPLDAEGFCNDLEGPVEHRHPDIGTIRGQLAGAGAELARMSGSGSAVFGVFRSELAARRAAAGQVRAGRRVLLVRTRPRNRVELDRLT